ncbi:hypothetical protein HMPREF1141_2371 [Clostridium sp. MSTE9]|nr:hypothetical protein HMPREF1141_2371 [Clostridium sp. MSTE9]
MFEVGEATGHNLILSKKSPVVHKVSEENIQELLEKHVISKIREGQAGEDQYMITELGLRVRNGQAEV